MQVAEKYDADLLVLESTGTFDWIQELYDDPQSNSNFTYLGEVDEAKFYLIDPEN
jgi:hypothetical protein